MLMEIRFNQHKAEQMGGFAYITDSSVPQTYLWIDSYLPQGIALLVRSDGPESYDGWNSS